MLCKPAKLWQDGGLAEPNSKQHKAPIRRIPPEIKSKIYNTIIVTGFYSNFKLFKNMFFAWTVTSPL